MTATRRRRHPSAWRTLAATCVAAALLSAPAHAQTIAPDDRRFPSAPFNEDVLAIPGDPARPANLQVTLFTPLGPGPFPLAIMNHGATNASATNRGDRYRFTVPAYYFLSRGYAVALPMMRGFAGSGGLLVHLACDLASVARANARDIRAVIDGLALRPEIDRTRIVVAGQSFGAWNTLGLAARPPPGVHGLIAFNAALRASDCPWQDRAMAASAGQLAEQAVLPSLWFYGENDTIMPVATWHAVFEAYTRLGGRAELVDFGPYKDDSHQLLSSPESLPLWAPKVDAFLARIAMPSKVMFPAYLPHPPPPPTQFAAVSDVSAVPFLNDAGKALYQRFLGATKPRAFVIAPNGSASSSASGYDPLGYALRGCARLAAGCQFYAVDDSVVWTGLQQKGPEASRSVARTVRMNVATPLGAFFALKPDCSSRGLPKVSIIELPTHGAAAIAPRDERPAFPPGNPYVACNAGLVPAVGVTYTPTAGYAGSDALTIEELTLDGQRRIIRMELRVV